MLFDFVVYAVIILTFQKETIPDKKNPLKYLEGPSNISICEK